MDRVVIKTKKCKSVILDVRKIQTADENLFIFYGDKKVKIPLDDIISFSVL